VTRKVGADEVQQSDCFGRQTILLSWSLEVLIGLPGIDLYAIILCLYNFFIIFSCILLTPGVPPPRSIPFLPSVFFLRISDSIMVAAALSKFLAFCIVHN